jgi:hypothetical protein
VRLAYLLNFLFTYRLFNGSCLCLLFVPALQYGWCGTTPDHCSKYLSTPECSMCYTPNSAMFDVEAINDIEITKLSFQIHQGTSDIKVYSAPRTYVGIETNANAWTLIAAGSVSISSESLFIPANQLFLYFILTHRVFIILLACRLDNCLRQH